MQFIGELHLRHAQALADGLHAQAGPALLLGRGPYNCQPHALPPAQRRPHAGFFAPLFSPLQTAERPDALVAPLRAFLESPRVCERTDDDKTLVLASRCGR